MNKKYYNLFIKILKTLNINVRKTEIKIQIAKYFNNPSLNELSIILNTWNIKNMIVKIPVEKLKEAPLPIVALDKKKDPFLITKIFDTKYQCYFPELAKEKTLNNIELDKIWSNICIIMESNSQSGEYDFKAKKDIDISNKITALSLSIGILLLYLFGFFIIKTELLLIYSLSVLGFFLTTYLLLREKSFFNYNSIDICKIGKKFDCDDVITSKFSKILSISLSELSVGYFFFIILGLIISALTSSSPSFLFPLIYLSSVAILYSIFSQMKMRTFCILCLAISSIIFVMIIYTIYMYNFIFININYPNFAFSIIITIILLALLKNYLFFNDQYKNELTKNLNFMNSSMVKNSFIQIPVINKEFEYEIEIGKHSSCFKIILFINPQCKRCKKFLKGLSRLFDQFNDKIHLRILYSGSIENNAPSMQQFIHLYDQTVLLNDIDKISYLSHQNFSFKPSKTLYNNKIIESIESQYEWSNDLNIDSTPALILNNIILPNHFGIEEVSDLMLQLTFED
jgi:uncharacterized membrane protein